MINSINRLISLEKNNIVEIKFNNNEIYNSKIRKKTNWFYYFEGVVSKWFKIIKRGNSFLLIKEIKFGNIFVICFHYSQYMLEFYYKYINYSKK